MSHAAAGETGPAVDAALREAAIGVLRAHGWDGLTLERVAELAGRARSTLWRQGITRESLVASLVGAVAADFRDAMFPILTSAGSGRDRLERSLVALCELIDRHLPLMLATDEVFHQPPEPGQPPDYLRPLIQFLREGEADGSITRRSDLVDTADVLFNAVAWPYVHMRGRHNWESRRARSNIVDLAMRWVAPIDQPEEES
jgi:AcrR family transcriptional regulator